jgi:hypothetical protein
MPLDPAQDCVVSLGVSHELQDELRRINRMSKLKALGSIVRDGVKAMEVDAEKIAVRMQGLQKRGADAFGKLNTELDVYEQAVVEAEGALAQQTNGGPTLPQDAPTGPAPQSYK